MHLRGANFCMTYLSPFSKLRLNANPVLVCFIFWFPGAGRALIFGQHGHLDNGKQIFQTTRVAGATNTKHRK